ncbi:hypothetical protein HZY97_08035 [Sphingomonas sp. R-74633]|uniref:hypothetical protein n=1 Tax=Sphingomonas sp. R-74633 TaxID=2751188 RepID=UPI0015D270E1|nr:hypothetical protein [Sphingomonas sp. R-74633]NYT40702.1 hypothetical protein [Sphingomonas sp. R-74633]
MQAMARGWCRRGFCAGLLGAVSLPLGGCGYRGPALRYRLSVALDTPGGKRAGSGVSAIHSYYSPAFPGPEAQGLRWNLEGEAVPVALPGGKRLFAVLQWDQSDGALPMLLASYDDLLSHPDPALIGDAWHPQRMAEVRELAGLRGARRVAPGHYPAFAWFDDIANPRTLHSALVGPGEAILPGIRLLGMTVEITNAPVTRQVKPLLPWLGKWDLGYFDAEVDQAILEHFPEYRHITQNAFSAGDRYGNLPPPGSDPFTRPEVPSGNRQ